LLAVSLTWFIYGTLRPFADLINQLKITDWITYPFGLYSTSITSVVIPNGTLYQTIGWGCLINAFYLVCHDFLPR
jgi:hypothetical protein